MDEVVDEGPAQRDERDERPAGEDHPPAAEAVGEVPAEDPEGGGEDRRDDEVDAQLRRRGVQPVHGPDPDERPGRGAGQRPGEGDEQQRPEAALDVVTQIRRKRRLSTPRR